MSKTSICAQRFPFLNFDISPSEPNARCSLLRLLIWLHRCVQQVGPEEEAKRDSRVHEGRNQLKDTTTTNGIVVVSEWNNTATNHKFLDFGTLNFCSSRPDRCCQIRFSNNTKMAPSTLPPAVFFNTLLTLLSIEQDAEIAETTLLLSSAAPGTLARAGLAILNLAVQSLKTGLGGRSVVELGLDAAVVPKGSRGELPEHGVRTGDIVRVGEMPKASARKKEVVELKSKGVEGVVIRIGERAVWVALGKDGGSGGDDVDELPDGKLWV